MTGHTYRRYRGRKRTFHNQNLGPSRQPRDEPLHPVLPLHALLPRLCRRARSGRVGCCATTSTSAAIRTACSKASSAATWWRSVQPAFSPTNPEAALHAQVGSPDGALGLRALRDWAATRSPASAMARCGAFTTVSTARSTAIFSATAGAMGYEFVNSKRRIGQPILRKDRNVPLQSATKREVLAAPGYAVVQWGQTNRHRVAARFDRSQFCAAHPGWVRTVLCWRIRTGWPSARLHAGYFEAGTRPFAIVARSGTRRRCSGAG